MCVGGYGDSTIRYPAKISRDDPDLVEGPVSVDISMCLQRCFYEDRTSLVRSEWEGDCIDTGCIVDARERAEMNGL